MSVEKMLHPHFLPAYEAMSPLFQHVLNTVGRELAFDKDKCQQVATSIIRMLVSYKEKHKIDNVILGLSGGVDSALTALLFDAAGYHIHGYSLAIHQKQEEVDRAAEVAEFIGGNLRYTPVDLTAPYEVVKPTFPLSGDEHTDKIMSGNLRARLRMQYLYHEARRLGGFVASTDNISEYAMGFWTLHGDVGDVSPIQQLLKTEVHHILHHYFGLPGHLAFAIPTDGLGISSSDEDQFGFSYLELDTAIAHNYYNVLDVNRNQMNADGLYNRISGRIQRASFKHENPYVLDLGLGRDLSQVYCNLKRPNFR